jgi:hypothetical protein
MFPSVYTANQHVSLSKQKNETLLKRDAKYATKGVFARGRGGGYATRSAPLPTVVHTTKRLESACSFENLGGMRFFSHFSFIINAYTPKIGLR